MMKFGYIDLLVLKDVEIIQVSIWKYGVILRFNNKVSITIEGDAEIKSNGERQLYSGQDGISLGKRLLELLECKVVSVTFEEASSKLSLLFDSDTALTLWREPNSPYESYQVGLPDKLVIV
jgi:hypothetical protein